MTQNTVQIGHRSFQIIDRRWNVEEHMCDVRFKDESDTKHFTQAFGCDLATCKQAVIDYWYDNLKP